MRLPDDPQITPAIRKAGCVALGSVILLGSAALVLPAMTSDGQFAEPSVAFAPNDAIGGVPCGVPLIGDEAVSATSSMLSAAQESDFVAAGAPDDGGYEEDVIQPYGPADLGISDERDGG